MTIYIYIHPAAGLTLTFSIRTFDKVSNGVTLVVNESAIKIENGNGNFVKEATTQTQSRKQTKVIHMGL